MPRYELSLSPDYVQDWGIIEAVRELFQNAIDQEAVNPENEMNWSYEDETLTISSKQSVLDKSSLLLGNTTKNTDNKTIGSFGEGYKLALLVLARSGYDVQVINAHTKEVWTPKIIKSKRYNSELLVIDVSKPVFSKIPKHSLSFVIQGIDQATFEVIKETNLHINEDEPEKIIPTDYGGIIESPGFEGKIFVNGLYVTTLDRFNYGYDIKPVFIEIGRDRDLVNSFSIARVSTKMWLATGMFDFIRNMVKKNYEDISALRDIIKFHSYSPAEDFQKYMTEKFIEENGGKSVPVSSQSQYSLFAQKNYGVRPVFVNPTEKEVLDIKTPSAIEVAKHDDLTPKEILLKLKSNLCLTEDEIKLFNEVIELSENWKNRNEVLMEAA
ncbi:MAG: hypothetical protein ACQESF_02665 [Nanobdellota archaeon]